MVPTKEELLHNLTSPQQPAENSQKLGLDVDPNELEKGQIDKTTDVRKMAAQVEDARLQRENNLLNKVLAGETGSTRQSSRRLSLSSSARMGRTSNWAAAPPDQLPTLREGEPEPGNADQGKSENVNDETLQPTPEEEDELDHAEDEEEPMEKLGLDESALPEDLHPLVQDLVEAEVHNNHTTWSVIRTHHREALAESLAVFVQLTLGFCADLAVTVAKNGDPNTTDWAWGFATMMAIYISGGVSGAHLNPTITTMLWFYRGFPKRKMPEYFLAQFLGAFCACFAAYGIYYHSIQHYLATDSDVSIIDSFVTSQRQPWITPATAFFNEFMGTTFLTIVVLALGDDQNAPPGAGMNSFIIGCVIVCLSMCFAYQTGAALNPSRDLGPRLALLALGYGRKLFTNPYWFYGPVAGSLSGAFTGAFLYDFMIFTGGESPINYPWERTQRAMTKSRAKWRRRLHLAKKEMGDRLAA